LIKRKRSKIVSTRHVSWAQNYQNCFCRRGSAPKPAWKLTALPRPTSLISGEERGKEDGGKEQEGKGGKEMNFGGREGEKVRGRKDGEEGKGKRGAWPQTSGPDPQ